MGYDRPSHRTGVDGGPFVVARGKAMSGTVLVVGGAGYIGSCCAKLLAETGFHPVVFDNLSTGRPEFVRFGPFVRGDIRDSARLDEVFDRFRPKAVLHFAARSVVSESVAEPLLYWNNNVSGSLVLLQACSRHGVEQFVFSSTAAVYGIPDDVPIPVTAPVAPVNPYGSSKVAVEAAIRDVCRAGAPFGATFYRYFNAAGAHPDADIGELHEPETHLIPNALLAARDGTALSVFGDDYPTRDGTCVRDYVHVVDLVRAHVAALTHPAAPGDVRVFNLGTGRGFTVREVLEACRRVTGRRLTVKVMPRRPGDPPRLVAGGIEEATRAFAWHARRSDLDTIVEDAWRWHRANTG